MENVSKASNVSCSFNDNPFDFLAPFLSKVVNKNCNETGMKCLPEGTSFENNELKKFRLTFTVNVNLYQETTFYLNLYFSVN